MKSLVRIAALVAVLIWGAVVAQGADGGTQPPCSVRARDAAAAALMRNVRYTTRPRAYARFAARFVASEALAVCNRHFVGLNYLDDGETYYAGRDAQGRLVTGP